jgi:hypothetical protein
MEMSIKGDENMSSEDNAWALPKNQVKTGKTMSKPFVLVTPQGPEDGGDFGPNTPRTKTGGIQEAIDYAHQHCRDMYIFGGRGGMHEGTATSANVYTVEETIRVPWSQDFRLDGGNYLLSYTPKHGHAVTIDSQMNCRYKFGLIISHAEEAAVLIKPETAGPDDFIVVTASIFDFSAIVSDGTGLQLDSSEGPIINSRVFAEETNTRKRGVYLTEGGSNNWISNNLIHVMYNQQYHGVEACKNLQVGDPGSNHIIHNRFDMSMHAPRGAYFDEATRQYTTSEDFEVSEDAVGAEIHAQNNIFILSPFGRRALGKDLVFQSDARENTVFALSLPNGYTNLARIPTNRIIPNWPVGFSVPTPDIPLSGEFITNTAPFSIQILILSPGDVSQWTLLEAERTMPSIPFNLSIVDNLRRPETRLQSAGEPEAQTIKGGLSAGQIILLEPGEQISFTYEQAPTWRWKALR